MNQVFARSDQLANKVYEVKLQIPEWKVLFALDGNMNSSELADFLEIDKEEVNSALNRLAKLELVKSGEAEIPAAETAPETEAESAVSDNIAEEEISEEQLSMEEEMPEEEEETIEEKFTFDSVSEEAAEDLDSGFEELTLDDEPEIKKEDGEEDLDQLINDLLKEESEEDAEGEEPDTMKIAGAEELENLSAEPEVEEEIKETEAQPDESDEFDLGDIFQTELGETEQSLDEMLDTIEAEEEVEELKEEEKEVVPPPISKGAGKSILVVDDSVVIRKMVEIAMENENYEIVSVATGKEALSYLDEKEPDLVILDIMLPDVNGLDILKAIKASKKIPVVMLSAKDTPRETGKAKELGADDFIPKPFKDEELIGKIHELIGE